MFLQDFVPAKREVPSFTGSGKRLGGKTSQGPEPAIRVPTAPEASGTRDVIVAGLVTS